MANIPFENLGRPGLRTDRAPFELPPEAWSDALNVRFDDEGAHKMLGHTEVYDSTPLHAPYWLFPWFSSTGFSWLYPSTTRLGRIVGSTHSDVTRFTTSLGDDDYATTANTLWSGTLIGDLPVLTYDGDVDPPQSWNAGNARFEDLPNWPASTFTDEIITVSDHLVALRVTKGAVANPRMVKWSQAADPGTYPSSWDETDPTTGAGEVTLKETQGELMLGRKLGNSMLLYKGDSVVAMRFVGGQSIFNFDTVFSEFGAISRRAVGVLESSHVVVTQDDVLAHNGVSVQSIIDAQNKRLLFGNLSESLQYKLQVTVDKKLNEVWISYPSINSAGQLDKALVYNYVDQTWSPRDLQEFTHLAFGKIDRSGVSRTYTSQTDSYNATVLIYDNNTIANGMLSADAANSMFYELNYGNNLDTVSMPTRLERTGLPVVGRDRQGEWKIDMDSTKFIRRVHPKMKSTGPVDFYCGGQMTPTGPVTWIGPFTFDPSVDLYFDPYINTRFFAIRMESNADISWSIYAYLLDLEVLGEAPRG